MSVSSLWIMNGKGNEGDGSHCNDGDEACHWQSDGASGAHEFRICKRPHEVPDVGEGDDDGDADASGSEPQFLRQRNDAREQWPSQQPKGNLRAHVCTHVSTVCTHAALWQLWGFVLYRINQSINVQEHVYVPDGWDFLRRMVVTEMHQNAVVLSGRTMSSSIGTADAAIHTDTMCLPDVRRVSSTATTLPTVTDTQYELPM
jgi:hypothetical protein